VRDLSPEEERLMAEIRAETDAGGGPVGD
jgi:hypothetical protein